MERREGAELKNYLLDNRFLYEAKTVTHGTQKKYYDGKYYYKLDKAGNEGLCEYLACVLLQHSSIDRSLVVKYEQCFINGNPGCRSKNFLGNDESFVTMDAVYRNVTGRIDLTDKLLSLPDAKKRLDFILGIMVDFGVDRNVYRDYLSCMMQFDLLIGNTDRHTHNYGVIVNNVDGSIKLPPLFDNGRSLDTDRTKGNACTLSGSFTDQVLAFGYPVKPMFYFNVQDVLEYLQEFNGVYEYEQLKNRLMEYGKDWQMRS